MATTNYYNQQFDRPITPTQSAVELLLAHPSSIPLLSTTAQHIAVRNAAVIDHHNAQVLRIIRQRAGEISDLFDQIRHFQEQIKRIRAQQPPCPITPPPCFQAEEEQDSGDDQLGLAILKEPTPTYLPQTEYQREIKEVFEDREITLDQEEIERQNTSFF